MKAEPVDCGFRLAMDAIGGKWKTHILWELNVKPCRFGELRRLIPGISEKVLSQQLREMEAHDLIRREVLPGAVVGVEYSATEFGRTLNTAVTGMSAWGKSHGERLAAIHAQKVGTRPMKAEEVRA